MQEFLRNPKFIFTLPPDNSGVKGEALPGAMPDGGEAFKITAKGQTDAVFRVNGFTKGKFIVVPIYFDEPHAFETIMRFYENYESPSEIHTKVSYGVMPGYTHYITLDLKILDLNILFLPRVLGSLKIMATKEPTRPEALDAFVFTIPPSATDYTFYLGTPFLTDNPPTQPIPDKPYVDPIGQWKHKEWKGKTRNEDEMIANYKKWLSEAEEPGKGYQSGGFFTTAVLDGMHYLIDPDGKPFFSVGVDCIHPGSSGPITGLESMLEELAPRNEVFAPAWVSTFKHKWGKSEHYDFTTANTIKAFGDSWFESWLKLTAHRLKKWGFNTVANWSDKKLLRTSGLPYVTETPFPDTTKKIFRDFPDVFSAEYQESAKKCAEYLADFKDDKNLIGYFLRNEPNFAFGDYNIALLMLRSGEDSCCMQEFIKDMSKKYDNDIARFNQGWETSYTSFSDLAMPWDWDKTPTAEASAHLNDFNKKLFSRYIEVPALACRAVDPNHLNLGLRWAWVANDNFFAGSEYIDVFSINCYKEAPDPELMKELSQKSGGKPVMIGEFHTGALDVGLPTNGICSVSTQKERGYHYSYYVESCAAMPEMVGAHYFQYNDQALLGRSDGENCNVGMVDVCGKPYMDMIEQIIETNARIMDIRTGKIKPTSRRPDIALNEGFCS